jgi:hypothetical protein
MEPIVGQRFSGDEFANVIVSTRCRAAGRPAAQRSASGPKQPVAGLVNTSRLQACSLEKAA